MFSEHGRRTAHSRSMVLGTRSGGSIPPLPANYMVRVAQLVERWSVEPEVARS